MKNGGIIDDQDYTRQLLIVAEESIVSFRRLRVFERSQIDPLWGLLVIAVRLEEGRTKILGACISRLVGRLGLASKGR